MILENDVVIHVKKNNQEYLQFKRLLEYSDILAHCYSVGVDRNYRTFRAGKRLLPESEYEENVNSYKTLCEANNLDYRNITKANQAHTDYILSVEHTGREKIEQSSGYSDGLITNKKNIILTTTNADCIIFLFFDPNKRVIANVHSGWRGTVKEISVKTVKKMETDFGCDPKDIIVCICPSIRKCHFEVREDVYQIFFEQFKRLGNIERFITQEKDRWYIDTVLINKLILKQAGILEENIEDCGICSVCNKDKIHSFRAEGKEFGLSTAIISL